MTHSVAAVILSYNSIASLNRLLEQVTLQTYPVSCIILVDNASKLEEWKKFSFSSDNLEVIRLTENRGVGYGHYVGWKKALDIKADFIWSLEHDCIPDSTCLASLLIAYTERGGHSRIGAIHPIERGNYNLNKYDYYRLKGLRLKKIQNYVADNSTKIGFGTSFNGTLFPRATVESIGYPRADFFVGLEDNEYSQRINKDQMKVLKVPAAVVEHDLLKNSRILKIGNKRFIWSQSSVLRKYYVIRNSLFMSRNDLYYSSSKNRYNLIFYICRLPISSVIDLLTSISGYKSVICRFFALKDAITSNMGKKDYWFLR